MTADGPLDRTWLLGSARPLVGIHDVALLDLDGTVYVGRNAVPQAPRTVAAMRREGSRPVFVTNNASRPPDAVATQLRELGIECTPDEVVTAAQAGAALLAERLGVGTRVLVVGGSGIRAALAEVGLEAVDRADDSPRAVLQGWTPELDWAALAEGAYALAAGLPWVVTNADPTLPTERGIAPGNGSFVKLLAGTTGRTPDAVAGKPEPALLSLALRRFSGARPLVVGDRLDTDVRAAVLSSLPSLLVLSGVTGAAGLLAAAANSRPTYVAADLSGLLAAHGAPAAAEGRWRCGSWSARVDPSSGALRVSSVSATGSSLPREPGLDVPGDGLDGLRAACAAVWTATDAGVAVDYEQAARVLVSAP